jgi:hypothetical protein
VSEPEALVRTQCPFSARLSFIGSIGAIITFVLTVSFLLSSEPKVQSVLVSVSVLCEPSEPKRIVSYKKLQESYSRRVDCKV